MSLSDPISDLLTRIRNGQQVRLASIKSPSSKLRLDVLKVLKNEGYIKSFEEVELRKNVKEVSIELSYYEGEAVIKEIKRISRPGLRNYSSIKNLPKICNGLGTSILSTSKGVMADHEARAQNIGGELLCKIF